MSLGATPRLSWGRVLGHGGIRWATKRASSNEWGTPLHILGLVRRVLGPVELDPASSPAFNRSVHARRILTAEDDALRVPWGWAQSIFLNPPGGVRGSKSLAVAFWERLLEHRDTPGFGHAVFLGFSLNLLSTSQAARLSVCAFPFCILRKGLSFLREDGTPAGAPTHNNVLVYVPGKVDERSAFLEVFRGLGGVVNPGPVGRAA